MIKKSIKHKLLSKKSTPLITCRADITIVYKRLRTQCVRVKRKLIVYTRSNFPHLICVKFCYQLYHPVIITL